MISLYKTNGQLKLTNPVVKVEPVKPFTFLVDGARISVANTVRLEQLDVLIGIDFSEARWKVTQSSLSAIINSFSQFGFFTDATLLNEFGGLCRIGEEGFARLGKLMDECFRFKNENNIDAPINVCSETPLSITNVELQHELTNLGNRFNRIKETWTAQEVKDDVNAQTILVEYCGYLNDFSIVYEQRVSDMLASLEELTDGFYPEILFGNLIRNCTYSINGDGEQYEVIACKGTTKGMRCQVEITQTINLRDYTRSYAVHYNGIAISGNSPHDIFAKTLDVKEIKYLECSDEYSGDFTVCDEKKVPEPCKKYLELDDITNIIHYCNFTKSTPHVGTVLPHGGLLIQGHDRTELISGTNKLQNKLPLVVYSPDILTIKEGDEDFIFAPAITVENLIIVESKISEKDIEKLKSNYEWKQMIKDVDLDEYIDLILIILQILLIPLIIISFYLAIKQKNLLKSIDVRKLTKYPGTENLRNNQHFLLKKIGK